MKKLLFGVCILSGCTHIPPSPQVQQPMSVRPESLDAEKKTASLYSKQSFVSYFEDAKANKKGDTLTVVISEKTVASKQSSLDSSRKSSISASVPTITGLPLKNLGKIGLEENNAYAFAGKGDAALNNAFTGNISVTVIDVFPNGNLLVSGEKQVTINQGVEYVRFSGVINPKHLIGNTVQSYQVADARLEYRQDGELGAAQSQGWLSKLFLLVYPF